jgi:hypothetical protein
MDPHNLTEVREASDAPTLIFIFMFLFITYILSLIEERRY